MPALPLSPEQLADAARLKAIYTAKKRELGLTQESLASACGWESQGTVSQYFNGKIPLNVEAAVKFAKELYCSVADFSPRLAAELAQLRDPHHTSSENANAVLPLVDAGLSGDEAKSTQPRGRGEDSALTPGSVSPMAQALIDRIAALDQANLSPPALYALIESALDLVQPRASASGYARLKDFPTE